MAALLREALRPNLVQTLEHTPCLMHGGPFANIAHGCNSVRATRLALTLADYTVTEAGFGSDLGAEKFFDIKCPAAGITPAIAVLVVTVRALRYNGGCDKESCRTPNAPAVAAGLCNLTAHVENLRQYGVPVVVAINRFPDDLPEELALIQAECDRLGVRAAQSEVFAPAGENRNHRPKGLRRRRRGIQPRSGRTAGADGRPRSGIRPRLHRQNPVLPQR